ncbi:toprim domain-containing protein [Dyadobacter sp. CY323]|uniref:toprim domain-containing protein n=1 Tax=Dyadobacter sp. CY323 TaxID=2907302 RepID=UPI001F353223|nr:toprim domain-containing protein [Dyadobacter sp. CY323]MCE6989557.1 toprim domain-containing protein [Dyadobacter sp. CY323]
MRERARGNDGFLTLAQIKDLDIVDYLLELGYEPNKIRSVDHWYLSPFRNERTASFKVNRNLNRWYDHGIGSGGNLVDFAVLFYQCTVREVLRIFSDYLVFHQPVPRPNPQVLHATNCPLEILSTFKLTSPSLIRYISSRCVFDEIAKNYCRQVNYRIGDRRYFGLGLQNDSGGYELRNSFAKLASAPKDITTIDVGASTVSVFEGMFDFLSYKTIMSQTVETPENHVILNSISLFERSRSFLESHEQINLYLDRDAAGLRCSAAAKEISKKYNDASMLYDGFKDLNDWLISVA